MAKIVSGMEVEDELFFLHQKMANAVFPEDVFGSKLYLSEGLDEQEAETREDLIESLDLEFADLMRRANPKNFSSKFSTFVAEEVVQMLFRLYHDALARIKEEEYGQDLQSDFRVKLGTSQVELRRFLDEDNNSEFYSGNILSGSNYGRKVIARISADVAKNRFLENQIRVMNLLLKGESPQKKHMAHLDRTFKMDDGRLASVADFNVDYYSLEEVRASALWNKGIPEKHMVWMLNRALSGIGYAHEANVINRNLNPKNVLIRPRDHNLAFSGWDYTLLNSSSASPVDFPEESIFVAPEILKKEQAHPSSDLYSLGKLMIYVLGGNPETNEFPDTVNPRIQSFLKAFVMESKWQRIGDAWEAHAKLIELVESLWGERRFLKFAIYR